MRRARRARRPATVMVTVMVMAVLVGLVSTPSVSAAGRAPAPGANLTVVDYNILHGIFCPADTDNCRASDRVALFLEQLQDAKCPQVVGLQEGSGELAGFIKDQLPGVCGGKYKLATAVTEGNDKELVFSTLPAKNPKVLPLPG